MNRNAATSLLSNRRAKTMIAWLSAAILLAVSSIGVAFAANPPPVQIYYIPVPEDQVLQAFETIYPGNNQCGQLEFNVTSPILTYISISIIADDTIIYYDHWEDDFEIDISTPSQPTTEIWGDGDPSNGAPPGIPGDLLTPGAVIVLENSVDPETRPDVIDFDGGDKLGSTRSIAVTRATWANTPGTLMAGALEVYDTERWGLSFTAPVGENVAASSDLFEYSGLVVMASEDGATVNIDSDANGVIDITVTLEEGASHLVNGGILAGAKVTADEPVQVALITGDICDTYESRWYALFSDEELSDSYYSPVSTSTSAGGTKVFIHNDSDTALTVNWSTVNGAETPLVASAGGTVSAIIPENSGAHFYSADGRPMSALAAVDGTRAYYLNSRADWGFTLVPEPALTSQVLVGWAPGQDPTVPQTENGSPVWVTPVLTDGASGPVRVCVDYNDIAFNRTANRPTDASGFNFDVELSLNPLESVMVFDPDGDQTGMMLYVCDEHATAGTAALAVAWGQAPGIASRVVPGLDLGTTVPPASLFVSGKSATIEDDEGDDGIAQPGDTITYDVVIRNASRVDLPTVLVSDTMPLYTTYILNTTTFDDGASVAPIPDNDSGTPFPLDEGGTTLPELLVDDVYTVTFQVVVDTPFPIDVDRVHNQAIVTIGREIHRPEVETPVEQVPSIDIEKSTNGEDADMPTGPLVAAGDVVTWTYAISSTGNSPLSNVIVTDSIAGVAPLYMGGDDNGDDILDPGEIWLYEATGVAIEGQYANVGSTNARGPDNEVVDATDPSHYFGVDSAIGLEKTVDPTMVTPGETVVYSYTVSNEGNTPLADIQLTDDRCAPVDPVLDGDHNVGDGNQDELLDVVELWRYTCTMTVTVPITNTATVTGTDVLSRTVTDTDTAFVDVLEPQTYLYYLPIINNQHPLEGLTYPKGMAVHEGRNLLFVTERTNNRLLVVNPSTLETIDTAPTGQQPWGVVINENANRVYVSNFGSGDVSIYDATTLAPVATVAVGDEPTIMEILPDQNLVFVIVRGGSRIAVIEGDALVQTLGSGGSGPFGIAADPVNQRIYVSHRDSRHISMLSRVGGVWEAHAQLQYDVGKNLFEMDYNPVNEKLYVVYTDGAQWSVDIWKPVPGGVWGRYGTVNVGDGGALDSPQVGGAGLEVNPSTGRAFNVNTVDGTVSVIDGVSNNVTRTVTVGEDPFPIAVDSQRNMAYVGLRESGGIVKISDE